jgi:signal transduction histidine kinase
MRRDLRLPFRPTVRLRLTLLYGALFLIAGAVLLALTYGLLSHALAPPPDAQRGPQTEAGHGGGGPPGSPVAGADQRTVEQQIDAARREERASALRQVQIQAGLALLLTSVGAIALGWLVAGRVLRPIQSITSHARHASEATIGERIGLRGPPEELKELADTIDAMLDRLQSAFDAQRQFAAQASHELRTPLAIIRAEADVALTAPDATDRERRLAEATRSAADRSERLVDGLLALARSQSTLRDDVRLDLADLVGDVVGEQARSADAAGVTLDLEVDSASVAGDPALLERLAGNLVENAIRYNHPGGWVRVTAGSESDEAVLRVVNSGPVVPPAVVTQLFAPFQRGPASGRGRAPGFGLGLAIAQAVAAVHGGSVEATAPADGGLEITVRLPLASPPPPSPTVEIPPR